MVLRALIRSQKTLSRWLDRCLPSSFTQDGNNDFVDSLVPSFLKPGMRVYDIGGGKQPFSDLATKRRLGLEIIGLDISAGELQEAPVGTYNDIIVANICEYSGRGDGDLAICQTLLEHVENVEHALLGMHSILKPGGKLLIFVPSRNAVFARLNLLLPHVLKRKILFLLYPHVAEAQGFPVYYDRCTPGQIETLAKKSRFTISEVRLYYISKYFDFFAPLYLLWRLWILAFYAVSPRQAAETFSMVLKKTDE